MRPEGPAAELIAQRDEAHLLVLFEPDEVLDLVVRKRERRPLGEFFKAGVVDHLLPADDLLRCPHRTAKVGRGKGWDHDGLAWVPWHGLQQADQTILGERPEAIGPVAPVKR